MSAFENILQVLPDTKDVIVVVGASPIEKFWKEAIGKEVEPLANRIKLSWTDELSFETLLKQASALPPHAAIFWELVMSMRRAWSRRRRAINKTSCRRHCADFFF